MMKKHRLFIIGHRSILAKLWFEKQLSEKITKLDYDDNSVVFLMRINLYLQINGQGFNSFQGRHSARCAILLDSLYWSSLVVGPSFTYYDELIQHLESGNDTSKYLLKNQPEKRYFRTRSSWYFQFSGKDNFDSRTVRTTDSFWPF